VSELRAGQRPYYPDHVISPRCPCPRWPRWALPTAPEPVTQAAAGMRHRDFLTAALVLDGPDPFPDNWLYIHEPEVRTARIESFRAWSADMVPDQGRSCWA
jgi:hypothetical protein